MSIIHNTEPYTELALYIEENLTKLVKLKLITRDRFKQFDQLISDYILADGLGDEERVPIYAEQIEDHITTLPKSLISEPKRKTRSVRILWCLNTRNIFWLALIRKIFCRSFLTLAQKPVKMSFLIVLPI